MRIIDAYLGRTKQSPEKIDRYDLVPGGSLLYMDRNTDNQTLRVIGKAGALIGCNLVVIAGMLKGLESLAS